ncbi:TIGR02530 family flagellar biosynthesis protein [Paenibacillus tarimensis]
MGERISIGHLFPSTKVPIGAAIPNRNPDFKSVGINAFREVLDAKTLTFSHHAETRIKQRGISLGPDQLHRIAAAIDQAEAKGAKDSLVLFHNIAMIVNVPSRTVITAMEGNAMQGNVFTQIDSAVVIA